MIEIIEKVDHTTPVIESDVFEPLSLSEVKKRKEVAEYLQALVADEGLQYMTTVDLIEHLKANTLTAEDIKLD